ncbi:hypothetical protein [Actinocorallia longicatena]|uniref:Alpha-amylase family glycosyl hydrolase n=1 Tax=Actinocorallia longicatena TaxID=111803 RepID=A0ABP6Q6E7_9ACTN
MNAPVVYEVNTWVWLTDLERRHGRSMTLANVPRQAWAEVTPPGVDLVWLMGVWDRSPAGTRIAVADPALTASFSRALPDLTAADVAGSAYCVRDYVVHPRFGGAAGLAAARAELAARKAGLMLDYVPNHVAPDHPWTVEHPEYFVTGTADELARAPGDFLEIGGLALARGRDPYFPPWPDVVQLNAFSPGLREATARRLADIADQCDAIRCDMAMLLMNDVFARTWGDRAGPVPETEFWPEVIAALRAGNPSAMLVAEAYWDREAALQAQGFDFCYDKRLYDRLIEGDPERIRLHLSASPGYQGRLLRFIENHDEPRAVQAFGRERARAAAVLISVLPGAVLWHEGQFDGRRRHVPVFLGRRPPEPDDGDLRRFYIRLLAAVSVAGLREGSWELLRCTGWADNASCLNLIATARSGAPHRALTIVNYSDTPSQGRVRLPWADLADEEWLLSDLLTGASFVRDGSELEEAGLYVSLPPWGSHLLTVQENPAPSPEFLATLPLSLALPPAPD